MARSEGAEGPAQHLADAIAAAFARTEQPGEHLAVHAPKLAIEPRLQILRRHRRSLLLRLEHPYCSAVEDHVNRAPGVGLHRSFNLRIGMNRHDVLMAQRVNLWIFVKFQTAACSPRALSGRGPMRDR